jgi:hypothetical protein
MISIRSCFGVLGEADLAFRDPNMEQSSGLNSPEVIHFFMDISKTIPG